MKRIELNIGDKYGRLTVIGKIFEGTNTYWLCWCSCKTVYITRSSALRSGHVKSCGCLHREQLANGLSTTHGECGGKIREKQPEYVSWQSMIQRCTNPNNKHYADYGGRGISVCEIWRNSYERFLIDIGRKPTPDHEIDRIDNDKGYFPGNCRWVTRFEQMRNTRRNVFLEVDGVTKCITDWANDLGVDYKVISGRIKRGWSAKDAVTTPKHGSRIGNKNRFGDKNI